MKQLNKENSSPMSRQQMQSVRPFEYQHKNGNVTHNPDEQ